MKDRNIYFFLQSLKKGGGVPKMSQSQEGMFYKNNYQTNFVLCNKEQDEYDSIGKKNYLANNRISFFKAIFVLPFYANKVVTNNAIVISGLTHVNVYNCFLPKKKRFKILSERAHLSTRYNRGNKKLFFLKKQLVKFTYSKADKIVTVSKAIENDLVKNFGIDKSKVTTIYNTFDVEKISRLSQESLSSSEEKLFLKNGYNLLCVGRLAEQKGYAHLLKSMKSLLKLSNNINLLILGDGEEKEELISLANKLGLSKNVKFLGNIDNPYKYMRKSDLFLFPSLYEGFGNVLVEAMISGVPIFSNDCLSGPREILCPELGVDEKITYPKVGQFGILSKTWGSQYSFSEEIKEEHKEYAKNLYELLENKDLRHKISQKALLRALDFSYESVEQEWLKLIGN